ncbi:gasdermin-A [Heliangelus exortis]|uniref:gasdermin-A n=1 Tax=Heliangelus exortis TaxID=472823 RepID=UPI003A92D47E
MFKKVTQAVVNQLDPRGDLVPVHSILDHEHFRTFCLVRRKRKSVFRPSPGYTQAWYRLEDVLLPGGDEKSPGPLLSPSPGAEALSQFTVKQSITDSIDGSLSIHLDSTSAELGGAMSLSRGWAIKLEKSHVPMQILEALKKERKLNLNHSFIQQLQKTKQNLYVVHEAIAASEETSYEESSGAEGSFMAQLYAKFCAKGSRKNIQSITIPKGCTLAFKAIQLAIRGGSWDLQYFSETPRRPIFYSDGISPGKLGALEAEVKQNCEILSQSYDQSLTILKAIKAVMRDRSLFQELMQKMEAVLYETGSCELKTESPDLKDLLSSLENSSKHDLFSLAGAISYTLDALDELTGDQLLLLLESLEEKIVSQQLKLVESILEQDIEHRRGPFSLDVSLLSFTREKEEKLTTAMVEMSRVKLQKDGSATCMEKAFSAVAALYVSLYVLHHLSN